MTWIETASGQTFDFAHPNPDSICIEDIAHALAHQCRFNGHCREFYSVAQHSVHVSEIVEEQDCGPRAQLAALLHDAAETYIGDMVAPLKHLLPDFKQMEKEINVLIYKVFLDGVTPFQMGVNDVIQHADIVMLVTEARDLLPSRGCSWGLYTPPREEPIRCMFIEEAKYTFLERFRTLQKES